MKPRRDLGRGDITVDVQQTQNDLSFKCVTAVSTTPKSHPSSIQVFHKYLPGAEFANTLPPFCEPEGPPVAESDQRAEPETTSSSSTREEGVDGALEKESLRPEAGVGVVASREATACVEEVLAAESFCSPSSSEVLQ